MTHTNSYIIHKKPKGFFRRLGEVFSPGKGDSTQVNNVIQEEFTDTLTESYSPTDTVVTLLKNVQSRVTDTQQQQLKMLNQRTQSLRLSGLKLSQKVNQLLSTIEDEGLRMAQQKQIQEEEIRQSSARTVEAIAIVAVLLASIFLIFIWRDITRSNHYRRELEKAKRRAEDLLVAREKLMLTITHDIKAPVGSIIGYTDLLERITTEERQRFYLNNMQSSAKHLLSLVNSLLDYHRLDAHKMDVNKVTFNPHQLFDTIYISFKPMANAKHLLLEYDCGEPLNRLYIGDPFRTRQIVENLLSNALKFTQEGSITLRAALENGQLHFSISDTGCGISEEEQKRIFQEFTRLRNAQGQEGFGLGLAITKKLILLLEGDIRIESEAGKGSTFHVYLPLPQAPNTDKKNKREEGIKNFILIDDDRIQLQLTAAMLKRPTIHVTCCEQPEELFRQLEENKFDALLTDIQMPYYLAEKGYTLSKNTEITVICQTDEQNTLMEDKDGNRFTIPSRSVETQRPLKMINPNYHYYMGGTWLHTFDPYKRPITEIISKWGDYTLCNKQEGSYTFPYLTHVSGISRGHSVTLLTDEKGIVTGSRCSNESSNLFGFLFFYSDILSLNVYEPQGTLLIEPGTDTDNSGSIIEGIYMYVLYTIPAAILLFVILWGMMIVRIVPNNIINAWIPPDSTSDSGRSSPPTVPDAINRQPSTYISPPSLLHNRRCTNPPPFPGLY